MHFVMGTEESGRNPSITMNQPCPTQSGRNDRAAALVCGLECRELLGLSASTAAVMKEWMQLYVRELENSSEKNARRRPM